MRFHAAQHLRKAAEFRTVREKGTVVDCGPFVAYFLLEPLDDQAVEALPRLGLVTSRRVGPAVVRNRVRRRLREVFRRCQDGLPRGCSLVLIARRSCASRSYGELEQRFTKLCRRVSAAADAIAN